MIKLVHKLKSIIKGESMLTVPAVSRISSIHCWQSTSTCCWGRGRKSENVTSKPQSVFLPTLYSSAYEQGQSPSPECAGSVRLNLVLQLGTGGLRHFLLILQKPGLSMLGLDIF